jgi:BlaI family transcriptional regulator, penicillinase repressor
MCPRVRERLPDVNERQGRSDQFRWGEKVCDAAESRSGHFALENDYMCSLKTKSVSKRSTRFACPGKGGEGNARMSGSRNGDKSPPSVSNAEWEVMKVLWDNGPMAARDVFAALPEGHGWASKTVKTLLSRLVAKGALDYEQVGNSYLYRPAHTRRQMTRKEVKGFVDRVLQGSPLTMLAHFIEQHDLTPEEIEQLRRLLEEKERKGATNTKGRG